MLPNQILLVFDSNLQKNFQQKTCKSFAIKLQTPGSFCGAWIAAEAEKLTCLTPTNLSFYFKGKRISPSSTAVVSFNCADVVRVCIAGGLKGGKGGFGAMLRNMAKMAGKKRTQDFGACRDLHGRRLRHVNDEIRLQKWQEEKDQEREHGMRAQGRDSDDEEQTESGIPGWHLDTPAWAEGFGKKAKVRAVLKKRRKTRICQNWLLARAEGRRGPPPGAPSHWGCPRGRECEFAHGEEELRGWGKKENLKKKKDEGKRKREESLSAYLESAIKDTNPASMQAAVLQGLKAEREIKKRKKESEAKEAMLVLPVNFEGQHTGMLRGASWLSTLSGQVELRESGEVQGLSEFASACVVGVGLTSGRWYYEVELVTAGVMQIGWADHLFQGNSSNGDGVGDDPHSWAYDGNRQLKWNGKAKTDTTETSAAYGDAWKPGDVVGCFLDVDLGKIRYAVNGKDLGVAFEEVQLPKKLPGAEDVVEVGFFPALSIEEGETLTINVGRPDQPPLQYLDSSYLPLAAAIQIGPHIRTRASLHTCLSGDEETSDSHASESDDGHNELQKTQDTGDEECIDVNTFTSGAECNEGKEMTGNEECIDARATKPGVESKAIEEIQAAGDKETSDSHASELVEGQKELQKTQHPGVECKEDKEMTGDEECIDDRESNSGAECKAIKETQAAETQIAKPDTSENYDIASLSTVEELAKLGLDILKKELQDRGVKCGGTLEERAARLFLVKDTQRKDINKKFLPKKCS